VRGPLRCVFFSLPCANSFFLLSIRDLPFSPRWNVPFSFSFPRDVEMEYGWRRLVRSTSPFQKGIEGEGSVGAPPAVSQKYRSCFYFQFSVPRRNFSDRFPPPCWFGVPFPPPSLPSNLFPRLRSCSKGKKGLEATTSFPFPFSMLTKQILGLFSF